MVEKAGGEYIRVKDGYLEIRQKLGEGKLSSSGKSTVLASTNGNKPADGLHKGKTVIVGLNAYTKNGE